MADDLITTAAVADLLGRSVTTINRWAAEERSDRPQPALTLPGDTGARLYRRADVEAYMAQDVALAVSKGACPSCTTYGVKTWHPAEACPNAEQVAS